MRATSGLLLVLGTLALFGSSPASAATCSDYSNQADAQRAQDTRDADSDGLFCEALPCPCLTGVTSPKPARQAPSPTKPKVAEVISARITSVVDGDTVKVRASGAARPYYTVRLIGIDTPESRRPATPVECGAKSASAYMKRIAMSRGRGRHVTLRTDPSQDVFDRYGRLLAYITRSDGVSLQESILAAGWAKVYVYGGVPFSRVSAFNAAQQRARAGIRGVWKRCRGNFHTPA
jgi:micrococcal nuclease